MNGTDKAYGLVRIGHEHENRVHRMAHRQNYDGIS